MAIDFNSEWFKSLPKWKQKEIVIEEFKKCKNSFEYFVDNYAYIRHPSEGILKVKLFDFQYDVAVPISYALQYGRTPELNDALDKYQWKYDYNKHMQELTEQYLDVYNKIPSEFHDFYKTTIKHPHYKYYVDTIVLKSRQVGLSTVFQILASWHVNFYPTVYDLVLSQGDREAKKFIQDIQRVYELIPGHIRAQKVKMNDHELWVTLSGKDAQSGVQALPPTPKAGRGYSPNLVILDEFAFWKKPEETYTAISMALSTGGVMVIISTPYGVGNLYHKLWELSKKHFSVYVDKSDSFKPEPGIFRPVVVHWSQIPPEEFKRRGFEHPIDWYYFMANKLKLEGGERKVAQELELDFITSGEEFIPHSILKELRDKSLEKVTEPIHSKTLPGLTIYEKPKENCLYILGVDVSEGVGKDYSVIYVIKVSEGEDKIVPQVVAKYSNNRIPPKAFAKIVVEIAQLYNNALINFEKNNPGLVLQSEIIDGNLYDEVLVFNTYNPTTGKFTKGSKGWRTTKSSKPFLESLVKSFLVTYYEHLNLPQSLLDEILVYYEPSYNDDEVLAYSIALAGYQLLDKYRDFLIETKQYNNNIATELDDIPPVYSSIISEQSSNLLSSLDNKEEIPDDKLKKIVKVDGELIDTNTLNLLKAELTEDSNDNKSKQNITKNQGSVFKYRFLSRVEESSYSDDELVF